MRKILFFALLTFCVLPDTSYAQSRKLTKAEREAAWRAERLKKRAEERARVNAQDSIAFIQAVEALRNGSWALEASNITFNNGVTRFVTENTNYVSINNGEGTVQTAFDNTNISSPNGLGGVTLQGDVFDEKITQDDEGNVYYSYSIQGNNISAVVNVTVGVKNNQATARIQPNFNGNTITMSGYIYPYDTSGVFQGTPTYY